MRKGLLLVVALVLLSSSVVTVGSWRGVSAQDDPLTAAVVEGSCDEPGDSVADLRDLEPAEGGVLTSFSRVDLAIEDLTGGDYAIVVSSDGDAAACGDVTGEGTDIYMAVTSQSDAGYGGIAWLRAREAQTQISLFISQGLGGSSGGSDDGGDDGSDDSGPPDPPEEEDTPTAEAEEDPTPRPTRTPRVRRTPTAEAPSGETTSYTSPSWGYSFEYDSTWEVVEETTTPSDSGPIDFIRLWNGTANSYLISNNSPESFDVSNCAEIWQGRLEGDETVSNIEIRVDDDGNEILQRDPLDSFVAFNFTWTNPNSGDEVPYAVFYRCYQLPGQPAVLMFINEMQERSYDQQAEAREKLMDSIEIPE